MPLRTLVELVLTVNLELQTSGLAPLTWGNASGIDRELGLVAIKPRGVAWDALVPADIVLLELDGTIAGGSAKEPSADTPAHLALYRAFPEIGGIVHTRSTWATAWAQAEREIPLLGTGHAELSPYPIPLTRPLTETEIELDYEDATGAALVEAISPHGPVEVPCALVRRHGPFCWGAGPVEALANAATLEEVARLASLTQVVGPDVTTLDAALRTRHFESARGSSLDLDQTTRP